jgi:hypothetical protein
VREFEGLRVALTGVFAKPGWGAVSARKDLELELTAWGAVIDHPLTAQTELLVMGASPSGPARRRAHAYAIEMIDLPQLRAELAAGVTRQAALARLRALATEEPSDAAWARLALVVEQWPDSGSVDVAIDYAEQYLGEWPHELRIDRYGWFGRLTRGVPEPRARLVRHAEFSFVESDKGEGLAENPGLGGLAGIWINSSQRFGNRGLGALLASPHLSQLTHLSITHCDIGDDGVEILAKASTLPSLRHLKLSSLMLGPMAAASLSGSSRLRNVTHLDLSSNLIGDLGARALASGTHLCQLRSLDLSRNHITDRGARALAASHSLGRLEHLELLGSSRDENNEISKRGAVALVESPHLSPTVCEHLRVAFARLLD